jgi:hypothetical protein
MGCMFGDNVIVEGGGEDVVIALINKMVPVITAAVNNVALVVSVISF